MFGCVPEAEIFFGRDRKKGMAMNRSQENPPSDPILILVVDDDAAIGEIVVQTIHTETAYQAYWVADGLQALNVAETIKPRLFILDYNLPQMNGMEVYHRLQRIEGLGQTPALFLSAHPQINEVEREGMALLRKPFEMGELLEAIEKLLAS
jgi:DNA-binding response OmpR family regulator